MFTIGSTGLTSYNNARTGLDISAAGIAYAAINNAPQLYTVNLATGAIALIGPFPGETIISDLAVGGAAHGGEHEVPALSTMMMVALSIMLVAFAMTRIRA